MSQRFSKKPKNSKKRRNHSATETQKKKDRIDRAKKYGKGDQG
jgi:hypothetical protein